MKVTVKNLGVVKAAEIDLKPLTILVGRNNTGKTWLACTVAAALSYYGWRRYVNAYASTKPPERYRDLERVVKQVIEQGDGVLDIVQFADECGERCINNILQYTKNWIRGFLSTDRVRFDNLQMQADLTPIKNQLLRHLEGITIEDRIGRDEDSALLKALKEAGERKLFLYPGVNIKERLPNREVKRFIASVVFREFLQFFYPSTYFFPTERTSIINDQFIPLPARNLLENTARAEVEEPKEPLPKPRLQSGPISGFVGMMIELYVNANILERQEEATEEPAIQRYMQLADILQEDILEGHLDFSTPTPDPRREILFKPSNCVDEENVEMEVSIASSMVKELSALVLYLRYLAQPGELLVIDEPEMNLHPAAQVKIIEFLVMLVNAGLRVLLTTHSTYIVDHLINLIDAYKHENKEEIKNMFLLESTDAFIDQNKVSVYQFDEDGQVKNILENDGTIHWRTFSEVTEYVQRLHFEL